MPPKRHSHQPRAYGRQARGKTIKSISLDGELAIWAEHRAASENMSLSAWIEEQLTNARQNILAEKGSGYHSAQKDPASHLLSDDDTSGGYTAPKRTPCAIKPLPVPTAFFVLQRKGKPAPR